MKLTVFITCAVLELVFIVLAIVTKLRGWGMWYIFIIPAVMFAGGGVWTLIKKKKEETREL